MAFNIHWKIKFKSLRAGTDYTVNIWKDGSLPSGYPLTLKGGAQPFTTQEDDDDDPFVPVREQSGYVSIVDDGKATNTSNSEVAFSWKDLAPQTDLDRPVTLTNGGTVVWQGFLQAQNFSGGLYGNPQEREFPVQCILTVLAAKDVGIVNRQVHNFAYLINACFAQIGITTSSSPIGIGNLYFQGGEYARAWLLKLIDWQNFVSDDGDGQISSRFDTLTALTDVCRFWGWTVRTIGRDVYFTCADDMAGAPGFLKLTLTQLQSIGNETDTTVGTTVQYTDVDLDAMGDIFASTANDDIMARGASTAVVTANSGVADEALIEAWPEYVERDILTNLGWESGDPIRYRAWQGVSGIGGDWSMEEAFAKYTNPKYTQNTPFYIVTCNQSYASIRLAQFSQNSADIQYAVSIEYQDVIQMRKEFQQNNPVTLVQIETEFEHIFDGKFSITGDVYHSGYCYKSNSYTLNHSVKMRFGIGATRASAMWFDGTGYGWSSTPTIFDAHVNYNDGIWRFGDNVNDTISVFADSRGKKGKVFIDLLGGIGEDDWLPDGVSAYQGILILDVVNFTLKYDRFGYDFLTSKRINLDGRKEYKASNDNMSRNRWDDDTVYASGNLDFGFGLVFDPSTLYPVVNAEYYTGGMAPEQHLANRVANYWAASKRMLNTELRTNVVGSITPGQIITLHGYEFHPIAISRQWRDDVTIVNFLEI